MVPFFSYNNNIDKVTPSLIIYSYFLWVICLGCKLYILGNRIEKDIILTIYSIVIGLF
jgi:hypothetical protein